jgi:hypothetical protein
MKFELKCTLALPPEVAEPEQAVFIRAGVIHEIFFGLHMVR